MAKKISKSQLMAYDAQSRFGCPFKYYLTYVKGIRMKPTGVMYDGIRFHNIAAKFYEKVNLSKIGSATFWNVYEYFRSLYPRGKQYDFLAEFEADRYLISAEHFIPVLVEETVEDDERKGIVDRLEALDEGDLVIAELKLSYKKKESLDDVRFELVFYADLLRKNGYNVTYTSVFFGRDGQYEIWKLIDNDFELMESRVNKILGGIERKEFEPVLDEKKCLSCSYQNICLEGEKIE